VDPRAGLDAVVKRKIPSRQESNPRTPIIQPVVQRYAAELTRFFFPFDNVSIPFVKVTLCNCFTELYTREYPKVAGLAA
jgi:hypothetical protein